MNFFSLILKYKKITTFAVLLFVVAGIIMPYTALAALWNPFSWGSEILNGVVNAILIAVLAVPLLVVTVLSDLTKFFLTLALDIAINKTSYTRSPAVNIGWPIVRDLANMMVVLGFVVIGIATTLRIQDYAAKKLLLPLIIAALLINFSLLITGIFIDASNIVMIFFFSKAGGLAKWSPAIASLTDLFSNIGTKSVSELAPILFGMIFFNVMTIFVNLLYLLLIIVRVVALWMLVILSPLAFVCYVIPATKGIWQMWWKNFFQWCIIMLPAGLFYYIGAKMVENFTQQKIDISGDFATYITNSFSTILVPGLFLIVGFLVSLQFSAMGAGAIMNFANKNKGAALRRGLGVISKGSGSVGSLLQNSKYGTAIKRLQSGNLGSRIVGGILGAPMHVANALGNYRATAQRTRSALGRFGETIGMIDPGTTDMKQAGVVEEEAKRIKFEYNRAKATGDNKTITRIQNDAEAAAKSEGGSKSAASMKVVTEAGDLHKMFKDRITGKIDLTKASDALNYAAKMGAIDIKKEAVKSNPNLAGSPTEIREATRRVSPAKAAEWAPDVITPEVVTSLAKNTVTEIGKRGSPELVDKIKKYKYDPSKNLAGQTREWRSARLHVLKSGPIGSPERIRAEEQFASLQKQLATDDNFT